MAPLDLTYQVLASSEVEARLFPATRGNGPRSALRQLFHEILLHNKQTYQRSFPSLPGPPLHDVLAVAVLLEAVDADDRGGERWKVEMVLEGEQDGRTMMTPCDTGKPGVRIPRSIDEVAVWEAMALALAKAEGHA